MLIFTSVFSVLTFFFVSTDIKLSHVSGWPNGVPSDFLHHGKPEFNSRAGMVNQTAHPTYEVGKLVAS